MKIFAGILIFILVYSVMVQRKLVFAEEKTQNALSQIGVSQESRWDLLLSFAQMVRDYKEYEADTINEIISKRMPATGDIAQFQQQENLLQGLSGKLMAIAENYPELKTDNLYLKTMEGAKDYEEMVRHSRMIYNDSVTRYNRILRSFPDSLIASFLGATPKEYLKPPKDKTEMPNMATNRSGV